MNWQEQLDKKAKELNITEEKGGEDNVSSRSNSRINSGDSNRRTSSVRLSISNRKTEIIKNEEKGGEKMITSKGALEDYEAICKEEIDDSAKLVKIFKVVIKLLLGIRTNQVGGVKKDERPPATPRPTER